MRPNVLFSPAWRPPTIARMARSHKRAPTSALPQQCALLRSYNLSGQFNLYRGVGSRSVLTYTETPS
jgi:hypothetical protein